MSDNPATASNPTVADLVARSNRLGSDPRNTNYAGGNTSAKGSETDPVTGQPVDLVWVKGSDGDLGTLRESGLAVLRLDRLRSLVDVYPGVEREDEMVAAFDYCLHGKGGAAPSIDTAMHGLVDAAHVDHLHPDSGIALATAADGEALTRDCFGDRVLWVPWRRPGFQLGLDIAAVARDNRHAIGVIKSTAAATHIAISLGFLRAAMIRRSKIINIVWPLHTLKKCAMLAATLYPIRA